MTDQTVQIGRRLKAAREAARLTQEAVAQHLGIPRPSVAMIEADKRNVSTTELEKLAALYRRDIQDFFLESFDENVDPVPALFRAVRPELASQSELHDTVRHAMKLARALTDLERRLGVHRLSGPAAKYVLPAPTNKWDAIQQGEYLADEERRRLGLGWTPLSDMSDFLEDQGIRTAVDDLPPDISGLVLPEASVGTFVLINRQDVRGRRRFSHAHEYCHVLVDLNPSQPGMLSHADARNDFVEVRANTFAASFLMPAEGVRQFIGALGKGRGSRYQGDVVDCFDEALPAEGRTEPRSQDIQLADVLHLAHHFGVSPPAALFRLRNLRLLSEADLADLRGRLSTEGEALAAFLGFAEPAEQQEESRNQFRRRFARLALEAFRRKVITAGKLQEIGSFCGLQADVEQIVAMEARHSSQEAAQKTNIVELQGVAR
jgi:Zn-dependent peptidase ImmA (M78 family)/transcriptional regulator with XRE-family HTH domain